MISIELAPSQFEEALKLLADTDTSKVEFAEGSKTAGHVHTSQIDADFEYQQRGNTGTLVFTNEVKHGMYKMVSDDTIGAHLVSLVGKLPTVDVPIESTEPLIDTPEGGVTATELTNNNDLIGSTPEVK